MGTSIESFDNLRVSTFFTRESVFFGRVSTFFTTVSINKGAFCLKKALDSHLNVNKSKTMPITTVGAVFILILRRLLLFTKQK
jgi:hypothetical protein